VRFIAAFLSFLTDFVHERIIVNPLHLHFCHGFDTGSDLFHCWCGFVTLQKLGQPSVVPQVFFNDVAFHEPGQFHQFLIVLCKQLMVQSGDQNTAEARGACFCGVIRC